MKTVVATVIAVLAVAQVTTALWMYGKLGIRAPSWLGRAHRATGATALVLTLFVAYHCLWSLGWPSRAGPVRTPVAGDPRSGSHRVATPAPRRGGWITDCQVTSRRGRRPSPRSSEG
jgi:hypothetical protein